MSYNGMSLVQVAAGLDGSSAIFYYSTTDNIETVLGTGYFTDGITRGMSEGDAVFAVLSGVPYFLYVFSVAISGCTVTPFALALASGSSLPTINPGPGSGLLWNDGGVVSVA